MANTQYNLSYLMFVPNFNIVNQKVPEKSLTEKIVYTHKQTYVKSKIGTDSHSKQLFASQTPLFSSILGSTAMLKLEITK